MESSPSGTLYLRGDGKVSIQTDSTLEEFMGSVMSAYFSSDPSVFIKVGLDGLSKSSE